MDLEHIWVKASQCREDLDADACVTENDVLLTPLSSGTTGLVLKREILLYTFLGSPKCVMLTHRNFNVQTEILKESVLTLRK